MATAGVFAVTLIAVPGLLASEGWDDHDRSGKTAARDFAFNYLNSCEPNAILFVNGDNDTFPLWYAQEVENVRTDIRVVNYMLSSGPWYVHQLQRKIYDSEKVPLSIEPEKYNKGVNTYVPIYPRVEGTFELSQIIDFIKNDDQATKAGQGDNKINYMPTRKVKLTLDSAYLVESGVVPKDKAHLMPKEMNWSVGGSALYKNDLMLLDFIATNNWERPVYFANPNSVKKVLGLDEYMHLEGYVYRLLPYKAEGLVKGMGGVNPEKSFDLLVNRASYGNLERDDVTIDRESYRESGIVKNNLMRVADGFIAKGENEKAIIALDTYQKYFPHTKVHYDMYMLAFGDNYFRAGAIEKGQEINQLLYDYYLSELNYINSLSPKFKELLSQDQQSALGILQRIGQTSRRYEQLEFANMVDSTFKEQVNFY